MNYTEYLRYLAGIKSYRDQLKESINECTCGCGCEKNLECTCGDNCPCKAENGEHGSEYENHYSDEHSYHDYDHKEKEDMNIESNTPEDYAEIPHAVNDDVVDDELDKAKECIDCSCGCGNICGCSEEEHHDEDLDGTLTLPCTNGLGHSENKEFDLNDWLFHTRQKLGMVSVEDWPSLVDELIVELIHKGLTPVEAEEAIMKLFKLDESIIKDYGIDGHEGHLYRYIGGLEKRVLTMFKNRYAGDGDNPMVPMPPDIDVYDPDKMLEEYLEFIRAHLGKENNT